MTSSPLSTCYLGIALILSLIQGGNSKDKTSHFHSCTWSRSNSDNFISTSLWVKGPSINSLKELPLIQLSIQSLILSPFPIPQQMSSINVWKPALIALQFGEVGSLSGSLALICDNINHWKGKALLIKKKKRKGRFRLTQYIYIYFWVIDLYIHGCINPWLSYVS